MSEFSIKAYKCDVCGKKDFEAKAVRYIDKHNNKLVAHICFNPDCFYSLMIKEGFYTETVGTENQFVFEKGGADVEHSEKTK